MKEGPRTLTATIEGPFGEERRITLVRQPDGQYTEAVEPPDTLFASIEERMGEERRVTLVRQPDGTYKEVVDTHPCTAS